jgi:muramidase (phage lysozyme)
LYLVVIAIDKKLGVYDLLETWCLVILQKYRLAKYSPDISDGMQIIFLSDSLLSLITSQ